jgi:hypothetical protein
MVRPRCDGCGRMSHGAQGTVVALEPIMVLVYRGQEGRA